MIYHNSTQHHLSPGSTTWLLWGLDTSGYHLHSGFHHKPLTTLLLPPHLFISVTSRPLLSPWEVTQAMASVAVCPNDSKTFVHVVHLLWSPWEWIYSWLGTTSWKSQRYFHPSLPKIVLSSLIPTLSQDLVLFQCPLSASNCFMCLVMQTKAQSHLVCSFTLLSHANHPWALLTSAS